MAHILDNPAWKALITGNRDLAQGDALAKYFAEEVSIFIGSDVPIAESFERLYELVPHKGIVAYISAKEITIPAWTVLNNIKCLQMVYNGGPVQIDTSKIVKLTDDHIPQMLALTKLTDPGPFSQRTIEFGHYFGIFDGDQLVAMAGQRMHPVPYAEISAVCTHPDHTGKGYAKLLLQFHINRVLAAGETPFLHVKIENSRAIQVYDSMGFETRAELNFYILRK